MGHVGAARRTVYCATKHAMEGFTKAMAIELAPHNIRVNSLGPTFLETPMTRPFFENKAFRDEVLGKIKLGRLGQLDETHRRHRVPRLRRLVADDRLGARARRRLDRGVIARAALLIPSEPSEARARSDGAASDCHSRDAPRPLLAMKAEPANQRRSYCRLSFSRGS